MIIASTRFWKIGETGKGFYSGSNKTFVDQPFQIVQQSNRKKYLESVREQAGGILPHRTKKFSLYRFFYEISVD